MKIKTETKIEEGTEYIITTYLKDSGEFLANNIKPINPDSLRR
jgi:hypothetical protein